MGRALTKLHKLMDKLHQVVAAAEPKAEPTW
jgi:hypothetical protein